MLLLRELLPLRFSHLPNLALRGRRLSLSHLKFIAGGAFSLPLEVTQGVTLGGLQVNARASRMGVCG